MFNGRFRWSIVKFLYNIKNDQFIVRGDSIIGIMGLLFCRSGQECYQKICITSSICHSVIIWTPCMRIACFKF